VRNAVVLPTPGTEAWWRAAVRETVYATREEACPVREGGGGGQLARPVDVSIGVCGGGPVVARPRGVRLTERGLVAADLTISEAGVAIKYNVYLRDKVELQFQSTDRSRVELAARLLRLAGVGAEVKRMGDEWQVVVYTGKWTAGHERLRRVLAEIVEAARNNGWVDEKRAERWLEKLEKGRVLKEGWPKYNIQLTRGALTVRFASTNPDSIQREAQRLREMGLEEGRHFTVKMPDEGRDGYVYLRREGLAYAAWLSEYGSEDQRKLAADFVKYILQRAEEEGNEVYEKAKKIVEEGKARDILKLEGFERKVEENGREYLVKVISGEAEFDVSRSNKLLLRIKITAEVDGVRREYVITYSRYGKINAAIGFATVRADAPGDAERLSALIKALTGREPGVYRMKDGRIRIKCNREHLEGFKRFAELADAIEKWLEETGRR
jgi:hypothetical protein